MPLPQLFTNSVYYREKEVLEERYFEVLNHLEFAIKRKKKMDIAFLKQELHKASECCKWMDRRLWNMYQHTVDKGREREANSLIIKTVTVLISPVVMQVVAK